MAINDIIFAGRNMRVIMKILEEVVSMLTAVKGYYDGERIVMDEDIQIAEGQEVIVTILEGQKKQKKNIDLKKYKGRGEKMFYADAQDYIKELRDCDRI